MVSNSPLEAKVVRGLTVDSRFWGADCSKLHCWRNAFRHLRFEIDVRLTARVFMGPACELLPFAKETHWHQSASLHGSGLASIIESQLVVEVLKNIASSRIKSILVVVLCQPFLVQLQAMGDDFVAPPPLRDVGLNRDQITPVDVLSRVHLLRDEIELIRFEMGKPTNRQPPLQVSGASPREVYFQGLTMFRKVDRLARDLTASKVVHPKSLRANQISPRDVWDVTNAALARVHAVKKCLNVKNTLREKPSPPETNPSDVFRAIVQVNRQLNLLLDAHFFSSDVYQRITSSVHHAEGMLERFPSANSLPSAADYIPGKQPTDVYRRLVRCNELLHNIAKRSNIKMATVQSPESRLQDRSPSDVYDIASLLLSDLVYLHVLTDEGHVPSEVLYPGRVFPSHAYQQAGVLEQQLQELLKQATAHPDWLAAGGNP